MKRFIQGVLPFPVDAQSNLLFCALSSVLLHIGPYDESTPFFCGPKQRYCVNCGDCSDKTNLTKYHLRLYHYFLTISGVGLMWKDEARCDTYDQPYSPDLLPPHLEDRLDFALQAAGYNYLSMGTEAGRQQVFNQIALSIEKDIPVLLKLGDGEDWNVVTGYDDESSMLYGLDAKRHYICRPTVEPDGYTEDGLFYNAHWFDQLVKAVVITGEAKPVLGLPELLVRMVVQLSSVDNTTLADEVEHVIDSINSDNAQWVAEYLNNLTGYAVEARWHAAECCNPVLSMMTKNEDCRNLLHQCCDKYLNTHDECWKIWGALGVGTHNNYQVPPDAGKMLLDGAKKEQLKQLFATVFENDRVVLACLRDCVSRLTVNDESMVFGGLAGGIESTVV